jgi:hypothetical protein
LFLALALVAKDKAPIPQLVVHAKYVLVTTYYGNELSSPNMPPEDRDAIADVQNAIEKWGRYAIAYSQKDADLILLVRRGRVVQAQPAIHIHTGSEKPGTTVGPAASGDFGDPEDMLAVYDAAQGIDSPALWRSRMSGGLAPPDMKLVGELRTQVEAAAKKP